MQNHSKVSITCAGTNKKTIQYICIQWIFFDLFHCLNTIVIFLTRLRSHISLVLCDELRMKRNICHKDAKQLEI